MEVRRINQLIEEYKSFLSKEKIIFEPFILDAISSFQKHWDIVAEKPDEMWESSINSDISRHFWNRTGYQPKKWISRFWRIDQDFTRSMFRDLFDESKDIEGRVERFIFMSDEIFKTYKKSNKESIDTTHDQDSKSISLYLNLKYPEKYALYDFDDMRNFLVLVKANNIPEYNDYPRFVKMIKIINTFINKDLEIISIYNKLAQKNKYFAGAEISIVGEFLKFCNIK